MKIGLKTLAVWTLAVLAVVVTSVAQADGGDAARTLLTVQNLSCGSCLSKINVELHAYEGMVNMDADLGRGFVIVEHKAPLTAATVAFVISDLGYPANMLSVAAARTDDVAKMGQGIPASSGFGCSGCGSGGCSVNASSWQKVYQRFFGNKNNAQK